VSKREYDKEFKIQAVRLVEEEGLSQAKVGRDLGVSHVNISRWVEQYGKHKSDAFPGKGKLRPEDQRIRDLEKQLKRVTMEREILKKALAFFGKEELG